MRISFIVTPGAAGLSADCTASLTDATQPGDEVIIVTTRNAPPVTAPVADLRIGAGAAEGQAHPDAVDWRVMRLGAQPRPGPAVAANAGLSMATGEAVVFLAPGARPVAAGLQAARRLMAQTGAELVIGRSRGIAGDPAATWVSPDRDAAMGMEAQPARMLLRRRFLLQVRLRQDEGLEALAAEALHWQACLRAGHLRFVNAEMAACAADPSLPEPTPEGRGAVFELYRRLNGEAGSPGPQMALRQWLARQVGRDLAALPPEAYWRYVEGVDPATLAGGRWPRGRGGRALSVLAARPLWEAVAFWQAEAMWRARAGGPAHLPDDPPPDWPQLQAARRAIALWRGWRGGGSDAGGSDSA